MNTLTSVTAELAAPRFAADPVGTRRRYVEFADNPDAPTKIADPYVNKAFGQDPLAAIFGVEDEVSENVAAAAQALGYEPGKILLQVTDGSTSPVRREGGALKIEQEDLDETGEVWIAAEGYDGNVFAEDGTLSGTSLTLVRVI
jgi:hypothetical protein